MSNLQDAYASFLELKNGGLNPDPIPAPEKSDIAAVTMDADALAIATERAHKATLAGVSPVGDGPRQLHIIAGLPGAFKTATAERIALSLPAGAANVDFDDYRHDVPGTAAFSQRFPMHADSVAGDAGKIRDGVLAKCLDDNVHVFYPGAFKSPQKMPGIVSDYANHGAEVHFHYVAGNESFNRLMTELRYTKDLIKAADGQTDRIIRNVPEKDYAVIAEGSPEVVDILEECGREGQLTQAIADKFGKNDPARIKALAPSVGKEIPLASLEITDRFGKVLYDNHFDGNESRNALDVIAREENRPFTAGEQAIIAESQQVFWTAAERGLLRQEDFDRIQERALGPVMAKIERDQALSAAPRLQGQAARGPSNAPA